jgi:WD40 repeat protein
VAVAPDGSWLVSGSFDNTVGIWDVATGQERATFARRIDAQRATFTRRIEWVNAVAVAPDGSWLVSGNYDGTVRIWDVATGKQRATFTGHTGSVNAVAVSPDGSWLVSGSDDGTVRIWHLGLKQARTLMRLDNRVDASIWLNTRALAIGGPAGMYLFDFLPGANGVAAGH